MAGQSARPLVSVAAAAERYGVHPYTIRRAIWDKRIPVMRVGRQIRLDLDALDALFRVEAAPDADAQRSLSVTRPQRRPARAKPPGAP